MFRLLILIPINLISSDWKISGLSNPVNDTYNNQFNGRLIFPFERTLVNDVIGILIYTTRHLTAWFTLQMNGSPEAKILMGGDLGTFSDMGVTCSFLSIVAKFLQEVVNS